MSNRHLAHWPPEVPRHLDVPATHLYSLVERAAQRHPHKPYLIFCDTPLCYGQLHAQAQALAGHLQQVCGVRKGDRVLLYMQNSPQFALAYYAILRADAVVVPVNPMSLTHELRHHVHDAQAHTIFVPQDLFHHVQPLLHATGLRHAIVATYSDHLNAQPHPTQPKHPMHPQVPALVSAPRRTFTDVGAMAWADAIAAQRTPTPMTADPDDMAVMPYTSGTTGQPKGCVHTHRSVMYNALARHVWLRSSPDTVMLAALPFFHVTGMQNALNGALYLGATAIVLPRWDRDAALHAIGRYRVTAAQLISTMVVDMLAHPQIDQFDLSSLRSVGGGGAAMPEAVGQQLHALIGTDYIEGYGLSETMAATHLNPPQQPKRQCLGVPIFDVDARVIDPTTLTELPAGEVGEIIVHGPQVMREYWRAPDANRDSFVHIDGRRFLRTGDLAYVDTQGYFFLVDRLKRMINTAGFKVWPAEVEAMLYHHPAIQEACVIAAHDPRRGETVKAVVVLKPGHAGAVTEQDIADWARTHMAAYKIPQGVSFADHLPKSASGKIQWRVLQEREPWPTAALHPTRTLS